MTKQTDDAISAIRKAHEREIQSLARAWVRAALLPPHNFEEIPEKYIFFDAIRALLAELDAARKDAARYRWLRNVENIRTAFVNWNIGHDWVDIHFEQLDAAVDAALNAERKNDA